VFSGENENWGISSENSNYISTNKAVDTIAQGSDKYHRREAMKIWKRGKGGMLVENHSRNTADSMKAQQVMVAQVRMRRKEHPVDGDSALPEKRENLSDVP